MTDFPPAEKARWLKTWPKKSATSTSTAEPCTAQSPSIASNTACSTPTEAFESPNCDVSSRVSPVAALGFVRQAMVEQQQAMGKEKGIVMDGRDIGTAVFPQAELKIFVTASARIRAQRRYDELKAKGQDVSFEDILKNVEERDRIDQTREISPLRKADDAILLDNSRMTVNEQKEWLKERFNEAANE